MGYRSLMTIISEQPKYDIFLDGSCAFCRWTREKIEPFDSHGQLRFLDFNDPAVAAQAPFQRAELAREMNLRTPDGDWLRGFDAWLAILNVLPELAWIAWIGNLPLCQWMGPSVYRLIARHRYSLPGAPVGCGTDACALPQRHRR
jgi:predicted DCC family thiol-disulfide oxidoreductase YuxK